MWRTAIKYGLMAAALLVLPLLCVWLLRPLHGLRGVYYVPQGAQQEFCAKTIAPDLFFPHPNHFATPCMYAWDTSRHGSNDKLSELIANWQGYLRVPYNGVYYFSSENAGTLSFELAGRTLKVGRLRRMPRVELNAGLYRVNFQYRGEKGPLLKWGPSADEQRILNWHYFYRKKPLPAATLLAIGAFVLVLAAQLIALRRWAPATFAELFAWLDRRRIGLTLLLLLTVVFVTRLYQVDKLPFAGRCGDEYYAAINGLHLVYTGVPSAWSALQAYTPEQRDRQPIFGRQFSMVTPFLDHPPGLSLLSGAWLRLTGVRLEERYEHLFENRTRLLSVGMAVINALLLFFFAARVFGRRDLALLAVSVFALYPPAMIGSRLTKEENFIVALLLLSLIGAVDYATGGKRRHLALAALASGAAILFKVTGLAAVGATAATLATMRRWRGAVWVGVAGAAFLGLYVAYGAYYDWETFLRVLDAQTHRRMLNYSGTLSTQGLWSLMAMMVPVNINYSYYSLTYIWFFIGLFMLWRQNQNADEPLRFRVEPLVWPPLIYLVFMGTTISSDASYGWYRQPLLPFLAIAGAWMIYRLLTRGETALAAMFFLLPLTDALYWGVLAPVEENRLAFRAALLVPLGLLILAQGLHPARRVRATKLLAWPAVLLTAVLMIASLIHYGSIYYLRF
ncbi:MAG TPA: glycosyltransferase family 39 protein [bacterium]|nr:glycosyltransferase family 39 protein [bacterium]